MKLRVLTCLLALSASIVTLGAAPADARAGDPHFEQPVVGECHNYRKAVLGQSSDTSPTVKCNTTHTAKVIRVFMLPAGTDWPATDSGLSTLVSQKCNPAFDQAVGSNRKGRAMTAYGWAWFSPTAEQREAGARWLRCDVILYGGTSLVPIANRAQMIRHFPDTIRKCMQGRTYNYTICSRAHAWRATGVFNVRKGSYPKPAKMQAIAVEKCSPRVTSKRFYWVGPTKAQWTRNYRIMVCFTKTHN